MWDKTKAVAFLDSQALKESHGVCAQYVRQAIEAGGVTLRRQGSAKDYGSSLLAVGFVKLPKVHYLHQAGDVVIIQPIAGHPDGHMAMFDGTLWVSDFKQLYGFYPGPSYREAKPAYALYRYQVQFDTTVPAIMGPAA